MRIGISELFTGAHGRDGQWLNETAQLLEEIGFDSVWVPERHAWPPAYEATHPYGAQAEMETLRKTGQFEALTSLAAIGAVTKRVRVGTYVSLPAFRHPLVMARELATVDQISNGRLSFGIGVSWLKEEYDAFGLEYTKRGRQVDEHVLAIKALWTGDPTEFHGEFVDFGLMHVGPKPVQQPHPPIVVGGNTPAARRRLVQMGDRWLGYNLSIEEIESFADQLHTALREAGRDPKSVGLGIGCRLPNAYGVTRSRDVDPRSWEPNRAYIEQCREFGLDEVVISTRMPTEGYEKHMRTYAGLIGVEPHAS
jgi:probable F420-dependent oxidoreductase